MAEQKQDGQHEHTFSNYVRIRDVVQKTCQRRWTIVKSGERGSGISVLPAQHDDDDDDDDLYNSFICTKLSGFRIVHGNSFICTLFNYWNLTLRLFSFISRILVAEWVLLFCGDAVGVFYRSSWQFKYLPGSLNKFPDVLVWALLLIVHTWNPCPFRSKLLRSQCTYCTVPTNSGGLHGCLVWACQWPSSQPLLSPQLSHNDSLWA